MLFTASDSNIPSRSSLNSVSSELQSPGSTSQVDNSSNDVLSSNGEAMLSPAQPYMSQSSGGWSLITAASFTQPLLLWESQQSLTTETVSQSSDPFSDEEHFSGQLLLSTRKPTFSDDSPSHQVEKTICTVTYYWLSLCPVVHVGLCGICQKIKPNIGVCLVWII